MKTWKTQSFRMPSQVNSICKWINKYVIDVKATLLGGAHQTSSDAAVPLNVILASEQVCNIFSNVRILVPDVSPNILHIPQL